MRKPDPRESKLPVWAQRTLEVLRSDIAALERDREIVKEPTRIIVNPFSDKPIYIPDGSVVRFVVDPAYRGRRCYVDANLRNVNSLGRDSNPKDVVGIRADDSLVVEPASSNTFNIRMKQR